MCLNPRIIINPRFVQMSSLGRFPMYSIHGCDGFYNRNALDEFDYKRFSVRRNGITKDNLSKHIAYNFKGETLPLYIEVPCGKCKACVASKRTSFKSAMLLEQYGHENPPLFLTLTYSDSHLPVDGVSVRDVQLFIKRFRAYMKYNYPNFSKFRYVCFSEYGSLRHRPHYHLIIFGSHIGNESPRRVLELEKELFRCWQKGFVYLKLCDTGCFNYVSKYVCKGSNVPPGKNPNFKLSSRRNGGIGVPSFEDESLYLKVLNAPHPLIKLKVMGKVFNVYIPKSVRERLFRSPRSFYNPNAIKNYKRFVYLSALLKNGCLEFPDFGAHFHHVLALHGVPCTYSILPPEIHEKFGFLNYSGVTVVIPSYIRDSNIWSPSTLSPYIQEYINLYKYLQNFVIDFSNLFEMQYLRAKILDKWKLSMVKFIESNPDTDPLAVYSFNAIIVESVNSKDCQ